MRLPGRRRHKVRKNRSAKRAKKLNVPWEKYSWKDILTRDGNICYLCHNEFDPDIDHGLDWSPTVDHVVPLGCRGTPGDVLDNVRIVHEKCNSDKGERLVSDLDLPFDPPKIFRKEPKRQPLSAEQERYDLYHWIES